MQVVCSSVEEGDFPCHTITAAPPSYRSGVNLQHQGIGQVNLQHQCLLAIA